MTEVVAPTVEAPAAALESRFPGAVTPDARAGYSGYVVAADQLIEVATALRDEMGYDYLSSVTGVDYIADGKLEAVYHACKTTGGPALVLKVQAPREAPVVPSLVNVYPGADFQEREAYDMYGIRFAGHPNLKRILMWEGFAGYPLRKDWKEAYYEGETKPFESRWPGGDFVRAEEKNIFSHNVAYPAGFTPDDWVPESEVSQYPVFDPSTQGEGHGLKTDKLVVNIGPQHPSTHGVFRMLVTLDGETIVNLQPVMGYLHRNHEKIGERNTFLHNMPFTDRLDYISSMSNNLGYALAVEKLMKVKVPERAEYIRVLMVELTRICNHLWAVGFLLNDLGAFFTPALYAIRERELILDFFEATAGSRMMCNYMRFGGVARDLPERIRDDNTLDFLNDMVFNRLPRAIDDLETYLTDNEIIRSRCIGVGVLPPQQAVAFSAAGPLLRASGVAYDLRRADPYSIYDRFDFKVCTRPNGDIYDRYLIRMDEMHESAQICQQVLRDMPTGGDILAGKPAYNVRVPAGESYGRVEGPKGELGFYIVSTGKTNPYRYHVRAPSFINITLLGELCKGHKVADVVAILGSIDIVLGETDR
ncbi:MAG: NADH-quinone oxidoreductase subunit D [Chloroflexi bacterium]|nr:NADH-quinone oxidoreductase subunit D [Chloroflexota bacterium]